MFPENTLAWGKERNCIRKLAEYSAERKREIGIENVYDYSIGNPNIPAPDEVNEAIVNLTKDLDSIALHGYTTAAGLYGVRRNIARDLNERFGFNMTPELVYITCGAAASIAITIKAMLLPGEEVIAPAPCFPEYRVYTEMAGGVFVSVPPGENMMVDLTALEHAVTEKTKAVIINSPNNPSGTVFDEENLKGIADVLKRAEEKYEHPIFLLSDEPYRQIVYDGTVYHSPLEYYDDAVMCYSFSKSLSIPGERIGYAAVSDRMKVGSELYYAIVGTGRAMGYVNSPTLFQRVIDRTLGCCADIEEYRTNRDILCEALKEYGYEFNVPKGAFYLFVKSPIPDANEFSEMAKKYELMIVPSDEFGCKGYIRLSYCISRETILRSLPAFKALIDECR